MKDAPHHMEKFIKHFAKGENPKNDDLLKKYKKPISKKQEKKQKKAKVKKNEKKRPISIDTTDDRNKKMKKRTPQIRERSHKTNISF